jgi:hypothetical protein
MQIHKIDLNRESDSLRSMRLRMLGLTSHHQLQSIIWLVAMMYCLL